jgi:hypothetical protein
LVYIKKSSNFAEQIKCSTKKTIKMKKFVIASAVLMAGVLSSCGDTNYCYEVKTTIKAPIEMTTTTYHWCTSNEIEAIKADLKETQTNLGIAEDNITIKATRTSKSEGDCHK